MIKIFIEKSIAKSIRLIKSKNAFYLLILFILCSHIFKITTIPKYLHADELSIGYNAILISQTLHDEHGVILPTYFEAFGEYKNPIYIYSVAILFKILGTSIFTLRYTSFIFFCIFLYFGYKLTKDLFNSKFINYYFIFSAGLVPWFFTISRISFEVISYVAFLTIVLYLTNKISNQDKRNSNIILLGLSIGLLTYTYSIARAFSFMLLPVLIVVLLWGQWRKIALLITSFLIVLIPFFIFTIQRPDALTARFKNITYLNYKIKKTEMLKIFVNNYFKHWDIGYLVLVGDKNLTHSIGFSGQLQISTFLLALIGILNLGLWKDSFKKRNFYLILLALIILAPIPSALTNDGIPHSLRSTTLGVGLLILSCYGMQNLQKESSRTAISAIIVLLILQNFYYLYFYFNKYTEFPESKFEIVNHEIYNDIAKIKPDLLLVHKYNKIYLVTHRFYNLLNNNKLNLTIIENNKELESNLEKNNKKICLIKENLFDNNLIEEVVKNKNLKQILDEKYFTCYSN